MERKAAARWRKAVLGVSATAILGAGLLGGTGVARADDVADPVPGLSISDPLGLLDNEMVSTFVEMCRTGAFANGNPDAGRSTEWSPDDVQDGQSPPVALATCTDSSGHGLALVLPERFEVGKLGNDMVIDLGPDIVKQVLFFKFTFPMGKQNLFNLVSGILFDGPKVLGLVKVRGEVEKEYGISIDPQTFSKYGSYETDIYSIIQRDAGAPTVTYTTDVCVGPNGSDGTVTEMTGRSCPSGTTKVEKGTDINLARRTDALKVAEYLTGHTYDYTVPQQLPDIPQTRGTSVIEGAGINVALSMRGGKALAQTGSGLSAAIAGADNGSTSTAFANLGIAAAANMNTDDLVFTWFGQKVDFSKLLASGLLTSEFAQNAGVGDMPDMLNTIDGINGKIPQLKEVYCLGVETRAVTEGLGSCSNYLGTFDTYKDLRPLTNGTENPSGASVNRQQQWSLTDASSLIFGNDAVLKQVAPLLGGDSDMSSLLKSEFVQKALTAIVSDEKRLKLTKDFIRYTKNVETSFVQEPVMVDSGEKDASGNPIMVEKKEQAKDSAGNPLWQDAAGKRYTEDEAGRDKVMVTVMKAKTTPRMVAVTEGAWERYTSTDPEMIDATDSSGNPIYVDAAGAVVPAGTEGAVKKQVVKTDAGGNPIYREKVRYTTKPVMVPSVVDGKTVYRDYTDADASDGATAVWVDAAGNVVAEGTTGATKKTPVMVQKMEQAKDAKGNLLWDPVVDKSVTAHWLTSDYGLREPLVVEWMGTQVVFFPSVEVNGTYRPNLIGLPQIKKIADGANGGLLPKISLVQWDNPLGLGTWTLDKPFDPFHTVNEFLSSITVHKDLKQVDDLLGVTAGIRNKIDDAKDSLAKSLSDLRNLDLRNLGTPATPEADNPVTGDPTESEKTTAPESTTTNPSAPDTGSTDDGSGDTSVPETPDTTSPDTTSPDTTSPDVTSPDTTTPEAPAPETTVPTVPDTDVPDTSAPAESESVDPGATGQDAPETSAPEASTPDIAAGSGSTVPAAPASQPVG